MRTIVTFWMGILMSLSIHSTFSQTYSISNCTFNYYSPTGGTNLSFTDDELKGPISIPFNFSFFGNTYNQLYICSNGFVTFDNTPTATGCCQGQLLPNANTPNNLIAAAWEDLYPPGGGTISYKTQGTAPNRLFLVTWSNVPHFAAGNKVFMQIQLVESNNEVRVMLQNMPSDGGLHTMGIENATGTVAYSPPSRNQANWSASNEAWSFSLCNPPTTPTCNNVNTCYGQSVNLTASGLSNATFQWYDAATGGNLLANNATFTTPALGISTTYYVQQSIGNCEGPRKSVTVNVNATTSASLSQTAISAHVCGGSTVSESFSLSNTGSCPMTWTIPTCDAPLATVLANLNTNYSNFLAQAPSLWTFDNSVCNQNEGVVGNSICDGGGDMFDMGNMISTNLGTNLNYSDNALTTNITTLGVGGQYFTRKVPSTNLWVFAADINAVNYLKIDGNLGADGLGNVDGAVLTTNACGNTYKCYVKRVSGTSDPSVNHLVIVKDNFNASNHTFSINSNDDTHTISNLNNVNRMYYLMFGSPNGAYISTNDMQTLFEAFVSQIAQQNATNLPSWLNLSTTSGTINNSNSQNIQVTFNANGLSLGLYNTNLAIYYNGGIFNLPVAFTVSTPSPNVLANANINLYADEECTDSDGWTHYYNTASNTRVLSIYKNGNDIGEIGTGMQVITTNLTNYGTNTATHISPNVANYVQNSNWHVMNRYWKVTPQHQPTSPVKVRFYFNNQDLADLNGSLQQVVSLNDLKFYKINGNYNPNPDPDNSATTADGHAGIPVAPNRAGNGYVEYKNGPNAMGQDWKLGTLGTDYYAEYEIDAFSGGGGGSAGGNQGALPIELISFEGEAKNKVNVLHWLTSKEQQASHFEIERKNNTTDTFEKIGQISVINAGNLYFFEDEKPLLGQNEYRLKMVDLNGKYDYSEIVSVFQINEMQLSIYPNPASDWLNIELQTDPNETLIFSLSNELGEQVMEKRFEGKSTISERISLQNLAAGVYFYKVNGKQFTGKILIVR